MLFKNYIVQQCVSIHGYASLIRSIKCRKKFDTPHIYVLWIYICL